MTSSVEAVLLDIDDTLCEYRRSGSELLSVAFERVGVDPFFTDQEYTARYNDFTDDSENMQDLRERCFAAIASDCGRDPEVGREVARAYAAERDHTNVRFCLGAQETLAHLSGEVPLAAVTNGAPEMQSAKLRTLGIDGRFETVVHAGYDAPAKPAPDPFHAALDTLDVAPERAVHVGNSLASDVAGAKNAGVLAAWLEQDTPEAESIQPDYVLSSMAEVPDLLG